MRYYDYKTRWEALATPEILKMISKIQEFKGKQGQYLQEPPEVLETLQLSSKIQSIESSNRIEGICTSEARLVELTTEDSQPQTRDEEEILGYREALSIISENYPYIPMKSPYILQLHQELFKASGKSFGGKFKIANNQIEATLATGEKQIIFRPVEAWETAESVEKACDSLELGLEMGEPLLVMPMFILDFLCIHPFLDGNGRLSRLLTSLLLYRNNYLVGKYVSLERIVEETKETYYESLQQSSQKWHGTQNDYLPFVRYFLSTLLLAYQRLEARLSSTEKSTEERIGALLQNSLKSLSIPEILVERPGLEASQVESILDALVSQGKVHEIQSTDLVKFLWNRGN